MDKRFQVFVSSTFADLKDERRKVIQTLMEMDCIPAGMELFPAVDEEQWQFIKKVIDDCDYYILIIGGRYGTISKNGISYTEKEYDYAIEKGLKVIAFLHETPEEISFAKSEINPENRTKLLNFKERVASGRLVRFWNKSDELPGLVALALTKTIKMYPAVGWVRANEVSNKELLVELNKTRTENSNLREKLASLPSVDSLEEYCTVKIYTRDDSHIKINDYSAKLSWLAIFQHISAMLTKNPHTSTIASEILRLCIKKLQDVKINRGNYFEIDKSEIFLIGIKLKSCGLISSLLDANDDGYFWSLSKKGEEMALVLRSSKNEI